MDTGRGEFAEVSPEVARELAEKEMRDLREAMSGKPNDPLNVPRLFSVGQVLELNGSRFKVHKIAKRRLILKLLADE